MSKLSETRRRINAMGMAEAQEELKTLRRRLFELRLQLARGEVKNNRQFPQIKADVARLMYRMSELNRMGPEEEEEAEGEAEAESAAEPVAEASAPQARARRPRRAAQTTQTPTTTAATEVEAAEEPEESASEAEESASEETE